MDEKKEYYRIDGMPLVMEIWIYERCSAVDSNIAVKKSNRISRIVNWMTRNNKIHYEFLMEGMFSDNRNPLKFKNIEPSLKEIAFYQLESKSDAITEITFQDVGDKDDDEDDYFTSKPPNHKPHSKKKGKLKAYVLRSTLIKTSNLYAGSRLKDKRPPVLNDSRKAKSTTLNSDSNLLEDNVSVQELHNCPDDFANRTPPRSSKEPQDNHIAYNVTDCGIYLLAFAEYLSEGEGIPVQYLDSKLHRIRYGALLWKYAMKKMKDGDDRDNEAPPRRMRIPARIDNSQLVLLISILY
uniref:Ubiquitin-like protease family profile domain-containing protein n=1 Tax=Solanum lycopersicum TaxID=4081 RepID=A0A3Q7IFJ5_SOLLC